MNNNDTLLQVFIAENSIKIIGRVTAKVITTKRNLFPPYFSATRFVATSVHPMCCVIYYFLFCHGFDI